MTHGTQRGWRYVAVPVLAALAAGCGTTAGTARPVPDATVQPPTSLPVTSAPAASARPTPSSPTVRSSPAAGSSPATGLPAVAHTLVFDITGNGGLSSITYVVGDRSTTERSVHAPWRQTIGLPATPDGYRWDLRIEQASGSITVTVTMDGQVQGQGSGAGGGTLDLGGSTGG